MFCLFFHGVFVYQSFLGLGRVLKVAENLNFLNLARYLHSGFFVVSWKKALRAGFRFDMVRTLNRKPLFCFSFSL